MGGISACNDCSCLQSILNRTTWVEYIVFCFHRLQSHRTASCQNLPPQDPGSSICVKQLLNAMGESLLLTLTMTHQWAFRQHWAAFNAHAFHFSFISCASKQCIFLSWSPYPNKETAFNWFSREKLYFFFEEFFWSFINLQCKCPIWLLLPVFPPSYFITHYNAGTLLWSLQTTSILIRVAKIWLWETF